MGADLWTKNRSYRDSYNNSNLLWQFELDYWTWFNGKLTKAGNLTPKKALEVLDEMKAKEEVFAKNLKKLNAEEEGYFLGKYEEFKSFLNEAITSKKSIECSI
jgi:hypothetical protein